MFWELIMIVTQTPKLYFNDSSNILDIVRYILVYCCVIINMRDDELSRSISVTMFILMWLQSIKLLMVFYATRYMIRLIIELIYGLSGFLVILLMGIVAYCQIVAHYFAIENAIGDGVGETSFAEYIFASIKGGYGLIYA